MAINNVDEYLAQLKPAQRNVLTEIRDIILQIVPEAEETISYGIPTYKYKNKRLIYFAAYKNHMSLFGNIGSLEKKLSNYKLSHRGTIQFTESSPLPPDLVKEIVRKRLDEVQE